TAGVGSEAGARIPVLVGPGSGLVARTCASHPGGLHAASCRVSSAAPIGLQPVVFWPAHIGDSSPLPARSAAARNGAIAADASGNAGASALIGPSARISRLTMPRA